VVLGAGALNTPALLLKSGITGHGQVGATFYAHLSGGVVGIMEEVVDPWVGATQGWGAISEEIPAMKFECLWAPLAALSVRWGDIGRPFLEMLPDVKHATVIAVVYRGRVDGRVRVRRDGTPRATLRIPTEEAHVVFRGLETATNGLLDVGARYVYGGHPGTKAEMRTREDAATLRSPKLRPHHLNMTANHVFGSARMGRDADTSAVDQYGAVRGVSGLTVCDASIFPSPSAVNPQATIMALSDIISRRLGEFGA
jgi:long-chain-alcohol oxidase